MSDRDDDRPRTDADLGWEAARRRQLVAGRAMTPAQRLRWLEETMATMRRWLGRARRPLPRRDD